MTYIEAISNYKQVLSSIIDAEQSAPVMQYKALLVAKDIAEAEIRLKAKEENGDDYEDDNVSVKISRPYKSWYDYDAAMSKIDEQLRPIIESISEKKIDKKKFDALVDEGVISNDVRVAAAREEAQTPRITITSKMNS